MPPKKTKTKAKPKSQHKPKPQPKPKPKAQAKSGTQSGSSKGPKKHASTPKPAKTKPSTGGGKPHDVCEAYWTSATCDRAFECERRHQKGPNAVGGGVASTPLDASDASVVDLDLFSSVGGGLLEQDLLLSPEEVHNGIKTYMEKPLSNAERVRGFVHMLGSVHPRNHTWVSLFSSPLS